MDENNLKDWMQEWFELFVGRFDRLDQHLGTMSGRYNMLDGERLLDNQDLCEMLHVSKRTLQRYRVSGELPFQTIYHKTYYKESDVEAFIKMQFGKEDNTAGRFTSDDNTGNDPDTAEPDTP